MSTKLQDFLNTAVYLACNMRTRPRDGDLFGVEVECEGVDVGFDGESAHLLEHWAPCNDGSLREYEGHPATEWVFKNPVTYPKAVSRVATLFEYFHERKTELVCSNRTSVHVHFNMGDKNVYQIINLFILFTIFEDLFDRYCGEERNGNLFCLSSRNAEEQIYWVEDCLNNSSIALAANCRYSSLNLASLVKFGSVEFRGMRGLDNKREILNWLSVLNDFCRYACHKMENPSSIIENISVKGPVDLLKEVFTLENYKLLTEGLTDQAISNSVYEGIRLIQPIAYRVSREWEGVHRKKPDFWREQEAVYNAAPLFVNDAPF